MCLFPAIEGSDTAHLSCNIPALLYDWISNYIIIPLTIGIYDIGVDLDLLYKLL